MATKKRPAMGNASEPPVSGPKRRFDWSESSAEVYESESVRGLLWQPRPDLFVSRVVGHADLGCVSFYVVRAQSAILAGHRIAVFHDWSGLSGYERQARNRLRAFGAQNDDAFRGVYYLVSSKIISMSISAAAVAFRRRLYAYDDGERFVGRLEEMLADESEEPG